MIDLRWSAIAAGCLMLIAVSDARAQVPFFAPGAAIFDPEISILNTGTVTDATATVSADRKYVTIGARFSQADLVALRSFSFQSGTTANGTGDSGFVGIGNAAGRGPAPAAANGGPAVKDDAEIPSASQTILTKPGMTLLNSKVSAPAKSTSPATAPASGK